MKVLFCLGFTVDYSGEIDGTGNWISSLLFHLLKNKDLNIEIAVCSIDYRAIIFDKNITNNVVEYKIPSLKNSKAKILLSKYALFDPYTNINNYMEEILNDYQPDIIQIFGYESQYVRLFGKTDIPIVIHFQGFKKALEYKYFQRIKQRELNRATSFYDWLTGSSPFFAKKQSLITSYIKQFDTTLVKYVLGRTEWDRLVTKTVSPTVRYFYCQELLRRSFYENEWAYPTNGTFQLFTITGAGATKNVDIIFEVAHLLEKYHPNFRYNWRIAGIDDSNTIVKVMRKRGVNSGSIQLLGKLKSDALISEINKCNLYVYPSGMDNSPNALMEAMLMGAPVLTNYAGGISSIVEHLNTGYIVNEGEPYAMAGAIIELSEKTDLLISMGKKSREVSLERNSPQKVIDQLLFAYKEIFNMEYKDA